VCPGAEQVVEGNDPYKIQTPGNYPEESIKNLKPDLQQSDSDTSQANVK
jgi:hypothetical protein